MVEELELIFNVSAILTALQTHSYNPSALVLQPYYKRSWNTVWLDSLSDPSGWKRFRLYTVLQVQDESILADSRL